MCGVIGVRISSTTDRDIQTIVRVFNQSVIRGKHASGYSYVKEGVLHTKSDSVPANKFVTEEIVRGMVDADGSITMVGHIRYSTSDLQYNQPIASKSMSIVHNGVISQEPKECWNYETETSNDSELILRSLENKNHPLDEYRDKSMAVCVLSNDKTLYGFRNHERPLWFTKVQRGIIFTSTKDIALRSGLTTPQQCLPFTIYQYTTNDELIVESRNDYGFYDLQPTGS